MGTRGLVQLLSPFLEDISMLLPPWGLGPYLWGLWWGWAGIFFVNHRKLRINTHCPGTVTVPLADLECLWGRTGLGPQFLGWGYTVNLSLSAGCAQEGCIPCPGAVTTPSKAWDSWCAIPSQH